MKQRNLRLALAALALLLLLLAGRGVVQQQQRQREQQAQQDAARTQVALQVRATDLITLRRVNLLRELPLSGSLRATQSALVKARVPGELQGLQVREGDRVRAGQVLARIDETEYRARLRQAQHQAQAARAQVDIAQRALSNNRALVDQGFISRTALDTSLATLDAAEANLRAAQAGVDLATKALDDTLVRAPIAGQIAQRWVQNGERVGVEARIVELIDPRQLEFEANLSPADALALRVGQRAHLRIEGSSVAVPAQLVRINPGAAAASRTVGAYFSVAPEPGLRHGMFAQGSLALGTTAALAVPLSAIHTDKPQPYVHLLVEGKVRHATVTAGDRGSVDGRALVAVEGVAEGSTVLAGAVGRLRDGTAVNVLTP